VPLLEQLAANVLTLARHLAGVLLSPGSELSVWSLTGALLVAMAVTTLRRAPGKRLPRARVWLRALFPKRIVRAPSMRADIGLFLLNTLAIGALIGWAVLAATEIGEAVKTGLTAMLGAPAPTALPEPAVRVIATAALFLAYEVAYWLDHASSHKIPFFWAFHKVHHTAEVLTPLTLFRVHPVDTLKFANVSALIIGAMTGLLAWGFGGPAHAYTINGANLLLVAFTFTIVHLQHSHVWIALTGAWGRLLLSPAHHQIHHSDDPAHFDRNFGSILAVWDWLAGTLYVPSATRQRISFGVGAEIPRRHSFTGTLLTPFAEAAQTLTSKPPAAIEPAGAAASDT
jgi:sterol desaturase/sphingolipid hydroxylase (fatty acid hydroxylase superfamily)